LVLTRIDEVSKGLVRPRTSFVRYSAFCFGFAALLCVSSEVQGWEGGDVFEQGGVYSHELDLLKYQLLIFSSTT
ncbi:hypothetical protein, partial [Vibrio alfacsensis]|uniref:hypothetical protein n=1 Tax=Vibrio alfacsensis TaxID=1074311 RepID=UPI0040698709